MFLSHTKEMFKKMNHVHPIGKNQGLLDDLGAEVSYTSKFEGSCALDMMYHAEILWETLTEKYMFSLRKFSVDSFLFCHNILFPQKYQKKTNLSKSLVIQNSQTNYFQKYSKSASKSMKRIFLPQTFDSKHTLIQSCVV